MFSRELVVAQAMNPDETWVLKNASGYHRAKGGSMKWSLCRGFAYTVVFCATMMVSCRQGTFATAPEKLHLDVFITCEDVEVEFFGGGRKCALSAANHHRRAEDDCIGKATA